MQRERHLVIQQTYYSTKYTYNIYRKTIMARPIKETPTLTGKDARVFAQKVEHPRTVTQAEVNAAREAYEAFKSIATFTL